MRNVSQANFKISYLISSISRYSFFSILKSCLIKAYQPKFQRTHRRKSPFLEGLRKWAHDEVKWSAVSGPILVQVNLILAGSEVLPGPGDFGKAIYMQPCSHCTSRSQLPAHFLCAPTSTDVLRLCPFEEPITSCSIFDAYSK